MRTRNAVRSGVRKAFSADHAFRRKHALHTWVMCGASSERLYERINNRRLGRRCERLLAKGFLRTAPQKTRWCDWTNNTIDKWRNSKINKPSTINISIQVSACIHQHRYVYKCVRIWLQSRYLFLHSYKVTYKLATIKCSLAPHFATPFVTPSVTASVTLVGQGTPFGGSTRSAFEWCAVLSAKGFANSIEDCFVEGFVKGFFAKCLTQGEMIRWNKWRLQCRSEQTNEHLSIQNKRQQYKCAWNMLRYIVIYLCTNVPRSHAYSQRLS